MLFIFPLPNVPEEAKKEKKLHKLSVIIYESKKI